MSNSSSSNSSSSKFSTSTPATSATRVSEEKVALTSLLSQTLSEKSDQTPEISPLSNHEDSLYQYTMLPRSHRTPTSPGRILETKAMYIAIRDHIDVLSRSVRVLQLRNIELQKQAQAIDGFCEKCDEEFEDYVKHRPGNPIAVANDMMHLHSHLLGGAYAILREARIGDADRSKRIGSDSVNGSVSSGSGSSPSGLLASVMAGLQSSPTSLVSPEA